MATPEISRTTESKQEPGRAERSETVKGTTAEGARFETETKFKTEAEREQDARSRREHLERLERLEDANAIINRNVMWALGAGVLPFPGFDILAVMGVELKMLNELSDLYEVPFKRSIAKKIIYSLLSGIGSVGLGAAVGSSLAKLLPAIGTTIGVISVPVFAGAITHAVGRVFVMHFEAGGTILDFDPKEMHKHFKKEYEAGREQAEQRVRRGARD